MSSGNIYERLFKLWATVAKLVMNGSRDPHKVAEILQGIVESGYVAKETFELYLHPRQKNGGQIKGFDLEKHLNGPEFLGRHFSLESPLVKGWIANPETYPKELKGKAIFLWGSKKNGSGGGRGVAYLLWSDGHVIVVWYWLEGVWLGHGPALLNP